LQHAHLGTCRLQLHLSFSSVDYSLAAASAARSVHMTSQIGRLSPRQGLTAAALLLAIAGCSCADRASSKKSPARDGEHGGELVAAIRDDPPSFNPYVGQGTGALEVLTHLIHAPLVRIDRLTGQVQPWLAERWSQSADGLTWTLRLRPGVKFADGSPLTSADVLFAFEAVNSPEIASAIGDSLLIDGARIRATAPDLATVVLRFPAPLGAGLQLLDNLPILPRHKLESAMKAGRLREAWRLTTSPSEVVGLGPFRLVSYVPAERIVLERNPFYWRQDADGKPLPRLDRLTLAIVRDQDTELLRLQHGQIDIGSREIRPEDHAAVRRAVAAGTLQLADAGIGLDPNMLWFNLSPTAYAGDRRKPWLQSADLRRAISLAVDRTTVVDQVYLGAGVPVFGVISPGNRQWYAPPSSDGFDPAHARLLLSGLGLVDRNGDGVLEDRGGAAARFSVISLQSDSIRMKTVAVVQSQLRRLGILVDSVGLDAGAIIQRWTSGEYDAIYFGVEATSYDPGNNLDFWLSSGSFHVWNAGQSAPATDWERRVDTLMQRQARTADPLARQALFRETQAVHAAHVPVICFAVPRLSIAMSPRVIHATPVPLNPAVLWNADTLAVRR
jgi:peptide/nickel transport system substrate-binding protein